jgi:RpiR family transcriptional regulator, carbohydrate utilization regulator
MNNVSVRSQIESFYRTLHSAEKKVVDFILHNPADVVNYSVTELAEKSKVSEATIVRACKKIGYRGYYQLKIALAKDVINPDSSYPQDEDTDTLSGLAALLLKKQADDLANTSRFMDEATLKKALNLIASCETLFFFGAGNSTPLALYGAYKFSQLGIKTVAHVGPEMQINAAFTMSKKDVAFGISNSGSTNQMIDIFRIARQREAKSISITNYAKSPLSKLSTCQITTAVSDKIFFEAFDSTRVPAMGAIDTLVLLFMHIHKERYEMYREREEYLGSLFKA